MAKNFKRVWMLFAKKIKKKKGKDYLAKFKMLIATQSNGLRAYSYKRK